MNQPLIVQALRLLQGAFARRKERVVVVTREEAIKAKMEELRAVSHSEVTDAKLRCAAKFALGLT